MPLTEAEIARLKYMDATTPLEKAKCTSFGGGTSFSERVWPLVRWNGDDQIFRSDSTSVKREHDKQRREKTDLGPRLLGPGRG
jgi:hypothetical protein